MLTALTALTMLTAPASAACPASETTWGSAIPVGDGTIQTFLSTTKSGDPRIFGVKISLDFDSLPPEPGDQGPGYEYVLPLPEGADLLPFDHLTVDWNPAGHVPAGVYDVPHFDFHFYLISMLEREEITPGDCNGVPLTCDAVARAVAPLEPAAQPPLHVNIGLVAPFMGNHLVDLRSSEFGPEGFSNTFMFGAWDGKIAFLEPMITIDYFNALVGEDCRAIDNPEAFATAGWYPTTYCVAHDGGSYSVTLMDFERYESYE